MANLRFSIENWRNILDFFFFFKLLLMKKEAEMSRLFVSIKAQKEGTKKIHHSPSCATVHSRRRVRIIWRRHASGLRFDWTRKDRNTKASLDVHICTLISISYIFRCVRVCVCGCPYGIGKSKKRKKINARLNVNLLCFDVCLTVHIVVDGVSISPKKKKKKKFQRLKISVQCVMYRTWHSNKWWWHFRFCWPRQKPYASLHRQTKRTNICKQL